MPLPYFTPNIRVRDLVQKYRSVKEINSTLASLLESAHLKRMFWDALHHDLHVIRRRSQNLADNEITVNQKAFATLMGDKNDQNSALALYVDEIIGLKFVMPTRNQNSSALKMIVISTAIQSKNCILGKQPTFEHRNSSPDELFVSDTCNTSQVSDSSHRVKETVEKMPMNDSSNHIVSGSTSQNEKLKRLFNMYRTAKADFHTTSPKTLDRTRAAKFLRDTIENCLEYMSSKEIPMSSIGGISSGSTDISKQNISEEFQATLKEAVAAAEMGSGGKKRSFDEIRDVEAQDDSKVKMQALSRTISKPTSVSLSRETSQRRKTVFPCNKPHTQLPANSLQKRPFQPERSRTAGRRRPTWRTHSPLRLVPATAGQSVRRVFDMPKKPRAEWNRSYGQLPFRNPTLRDRYRPSYK